MQAITRRLKRGKRGISTVIVIMLSLVLVVIIVGNVVLWNFQMNQSDLDRMQETLSLTNVAHTRSPWVTAQNEFSLISGSNSGGTYVDTKILDGAHETFRAEPQGFDEFSPSSYLTGGLTEYLSGGVTDLTSNDNSAYMTFRSYASGAASTAKTDAFIAYRDSSTTLNTPKERTWNGSTTAWGAQSELPASDSPIRWVRTAYCPLESRRNEKIVVTISDAASIDAYIWTGTTWIVTNDVAFSGTSANAYRCFDVAYEKTSGRVLLVYSRGATTLEIGYKFWTPETGWSAEQFLNLPYTSGTVRWVSLASCPGTRAGTADDNEIAMVYLDSNTDVHGYVWSGSTWNIMGATAVWDNTAAISTEECNAVNYEQATSEAMFIWADTTSTDFYYKTWNGAALSATTLLDIPDANVGNWVTLKADPVSDDLLFTVIDGSSNLNTAYWHGGAWTVHTEHDNGVDTNSARCADFAWEPTDGKGLLVWGTTSGKLSYRTFTAPNTWGTAQTPSMGGSNAHLWVQLRTNSRSVSGDTKILGAILENTAFDLGAVSWDGTTFTVIGASTISSSTSVGTYECFDVEFANFGASTQYTCEAEFSGTANAQNWKQAEWMVDLAFTTPDVNATFQLYNYNASQYLTSGDGYMTQVIGQTDVTKNQTITTNPTHFRGAGNTWKMKITGTKANSAQFDMKIDCVRLKVIPSDACRLDIYNNFTVDPVAYPRSNISGFEIKVRYNATENMDRWFLKAYNWETSTFTDAGFNNTAGNTPAFKGWTDYAIIVTTDWDHYIKSDGAMRIEFYDEGSRTNQTVAEVDFMGVRVLLNSTTLEIKNTGPSNVHVIAIWITTSTSHQRYSADSFINSGESTEYLQQDISLPQNAFVAKIVTERGNIAVFSSG